jgi:hypothetical protein
MKVTVSSNKKPLIQQESGMAILMVMTAITLLTFLLADFTFETKLNKLKSYNLQDKIQAKLNAEAGLRFAMAKLRIYKEARNTLEKNKSAQGMIQPSTLEAVAVQPFVFPLPVPAKANLIQKTAIEDFVKDTLLKGELSVTISSVSGFLNPNNLRIAPKSDEESQQEQSDEEKAKDPQVFIETKLVEMITQTLQQKREQDDQFDALYGNLDPMMLVKELKFFVNAENAYDEPERAEFEALYNSKNITPKHAPLTSLDELHLLDGWNDALIDLVKDRLTVHEVGVIQINEITKDQLKLLFPDASEEQLEEFFKKRDGDQLLQETGQQFKSAEEFKEFVVQTLGLVDNAEYDNRIKDLTAAGLTIGVAGKLYKVISVGKFGRASYTLTAYVDMPIKPQPLKKKNPQDQQSPGDPPPGEEDDVPPPAGQEGGDKDKPPVELLDPRLVEIRVGVSD